MKKTKNKAIQGIKVLGSPLLCCALFVSIGGACFGTKKTIALSSMSGIKNPGFDGSGSATDESTEGDDEVDQQDSDRTDENGNLLPATSGAKQAYAGAVPGAKGGTEGVVEDENIVKQKGMPAKDGTTEVAQTDQKGSGVSKEGGDIGNEGKNGVNTRLKADDDLLKNSGGIGTRGAEVKTKKDQPKDFKRKVEKVKDLMKAVKAMNLVLPKNSTDGDACQYDKLMQGMENLENGLKPYKDKHFKAYDDLKNNKGNTLSEDKGNNLRELEQTIDSAIPHFENLLSKSQPKRVNTG